MIKISELKHRILDIPDLSLEQGLTAIIGPNGSGKSTLLEVCAGVELPGSGFITIDGRMPRDCIVGWVCEFPERNIIFERVYDEIASPMRFRHLPCEDIEERVHETADRVGISGLIHSSTRELSGGEKALVALATALVSSPDILVLDETDSHLDRSTSMRMQRIIERCSIPYILQCTQNMETAAQADSILFLQNGSVEKNGTPENVFCALKETCFYPPVWRLQQ
jgi:energy-coupling factor transport system ATP-binding protein